jgi:thiol-disulfide isomerase/thioredoxin
MRIKIHLQMLLFCLSALVNAEGQGTSTKVSLHIGDKMPDVSFSLKNFSKPAVRFSEFKDKVVILDFWFGACLGCIEAFPKMEQLQEEFKDRLQIIMVNFQSQKTIDSTFEMHRRKSTLYRNPTLPSVVSDTLFHQLFSFAYYPHLVWIDSKGIVRAFTNPEDVTEKNIRLLMEQNRVQMDMKLDDLHFDKKQAVLPQFFSYFPSHVKYYSAIMSYVDGVRNVGFQYVVDSATGAVKILMQNGSLLDLLGFALSKGVYGDPYQFPMFDFGKRVELHIRDSSKWFFQEKAGLSRLQWEQLHCYSYEAVEPLDARPKLYDLMLFDLQKFFRFSYRIEKKEMECLALVRTSKEDKIRSKEGKALRLNDPRVDMNKLQFYAAKTEWIANAIAQANKEAVFTFTDETGYNDRVDIEIDKKVMSDLPALRRELARYDLDLVRERKSFDVVVIFESPNSP